MFFDNVNAITVGAGVRGYEKAFVAEKFGEIGIYIYPSYNAIPFYFGKALGNRQ